MSRFDFINAQSGVVVERDYPIGCAPKRIRVAGRVFKRLLSAPQLVIPRSISFAASSLHPDTFKFHKGEFRKDANGDIEPVFTSRNEIEHFEAASAVGGNPHKFGGDYADKCADGGKRYRASLTEQAIKPGSGRRLGEPGSAVCGDEQEPGAGALGSSGRSTPRAKRRAKPVRASKRAATRAG